MKAKQMKPPAFRMMRTWDPTDACPFMVNGVGVLEPMRPGCVNRPVGTGDWLLMYFHQETVVKVAGRKRRLPSGLMIWPKGAGHFYGLADRPWLHSWIHCHGTAVSRMLEQADLKADAYYPFEDSDFIIRYLKLIYKEAQGRFPEDERITRNLFENLLFELSRRVEPSLTRPLTPPWLYKVQTFIRQHLTESITLRRLAGIASVSVPTLSATFRKHMGVSPIDYVIRQRIKMAKYQLLDHGLSVADVAERCGYNDIYHFSKQFKKIAGLSPRAYRNGATSTSSHL